MSSPRAQPGTRALLLVAALALGVQATGLTSPFIAWDDGLYVFDNPRIQAPGLAGLLTLWNAADARSANFIEYYPLRDTVYWAVWQAFGRESVPFHVVSALFHLASCLVLVFLALRLGFSRDVAVAGSAIFAVHPLHVESVTWVAGLKDPMFTCFALAATLAYLHFRERPTAKRYALAMLFCAASLLSKGMALGLPLVFAVIEWKLPPKVSFLSAARRLVVPAALSGVALVQALLVAQATRVIVPLHGGSVGTHAFLALWAFTRHLQQAFAPLTLQIHYCFEPFAGPTDGRLPRIALALALVGALSFKAFRQWPLASVGIVWIVAFLLPSSNIVPHPTHMTDRYLYAPSAASALAMAWGFFRLRRKWALLITTLCVATFGALSLVRAQAFHDQEVLWQEVVADGVCAKDDLATSVTAYLQHAQFASNPADSVESFRAAFTHARFAKIPDVQQCLYWEAGAQAALHASDKALASAWALEATTRCPTHASAWSLVLQAAQGVDPSLAATAAERLHTLTPTADTLWFLGHARLAAGDLRGGSDIAQAIAQAAQRLCPALLAWWDTANAHQTSAVGSEARAACLSHSAVPVSP